MAHPDLDALLNPLLSFAQQQLSKRGSFFPFAANMATDGQIAMVGGYTGEEHPAPNDLIEFFVDCLSREAAAGRIRAAGICLDSQVLPPNGSKKTDAIWVQLEHAEGQCVDVYLPYRKGFLGRFKYDEIFAGNRTGRIFTEKGHAG
jgi:hypothetical protein